MSDGAGSHNGLRTDPYAAKSPRDSRYWSRDNQGRDGAMVFGQGGFGPVHWFLLFGILFLCLLLLATFWPRSTADYFIVTPQNSGRDLGSHNGWSSHAEGADQWSQSLVPVTRPVIAPSLASTTVDVEGPPSVPVEESEWLGIAPRQKYNSVIDGSCSVWPGTVSIRAFFASEKTGPGDLTAASQYADRIGWAQKGAAQPRFVAIPYRLEDQPGFLLTTELTCAQAAALTTATLTFPKGFAGAADDQHMPSRLTIEGPLGKVDIASDKSRDGVFRIHHERDRGWLRVDWHEWSAPIETASLDKDIAQLVREHEVRQGS